MIFIWVWYKDQFSSLVQGADLHTKIQKNYKNDENLHLTSLSSSTVLIFA